MKDKTNSIQIPKIRKIISKIKIIENDNNILKSTIKDQSKKINDYEDTKNRNINIIAINESTIECLNKKIQELTNQLEVNEEVASIKLNDINELNESIKSN